MVNKLKGKIFITGKLRAETGLHIGGSKTSMDIGGVDLNVIKSAKGVPFIPGSSLKGKLRSMLARTEGSIAIDRDKDKENVYDEDFAYMNQLFGLSGNEKDKGEPSRLIIRDAMLDNTHFESAFEDNEMDYEFTDVKWENTIDRRKGTAQHPRQLERVPVGSKFNFEFVYDLYEDAITDDYKHHKDDKTNWGLKVIERHAVALKTAMKLLQDDYLGGQGTRGYGKISFAEVEVKQKTFDSSTGDYSPTDSVHPEFSKIKDSFNLQA